MMEEAEEEGGRQASGFILRAGPSLRRQGKGGDLARLTDVCPGHGPEGILGDQAGVGPEA